MYLLLHSVCYDSKHYVASGKILLCPHESIKVGNANNIPDRVCENTLWHFEKHCLKVADVIVWWHWEQYKGKILATSNALSFFLILLWKLLLGQLIMLWAEYILCLYQGINLPAGFFQKQSVKNVSIILNNSIVFFSW